MASFDPALVPLAVVAGASLVLAALRAIWLYGRPTRTLAALLGVSTAGLGAALTGWLLPAAPTWLVPLGLAIAIGPLSIWLVFRWLSYQGPPPGLLRGPAALEKAEDVLNESLPTDAKPERREGPDDPEA